MTTTHETATVSTSIEHTADGYRVVFSTPPGGFTEPQQDALQVAISLAHRQLAAARRSIAAPLDVADPFTLQHDRMAAPC